MAKCVVVKKEFLMLIWIEEFKDILRNTYYGNVTHYSSTHLTCNPPIITEQLL